MFNVDRALDNIGHGGWTSYVVLMRKCVCFSLTGDGGKLNEVKRANALFGSNNRFS